MQYMGSKNRLSKELVPIIQSYIDNNGIKNYLEPMVGGANVIDKIVCENRYGSDIHKQLIALLNYVKDNYEKLPDTITEEEYNKVKNNKDSYDDWYVGLVGFCAFANKYFCGYAKNSKEDTLGRANSYIRNIKKQAPNLKKIIFNHCDFSEINEIKNFVIYCDIPYKDTTKYSTSKFPYDKFYEWCRKMSKDNIVLISEYNMPNDFKCIWEKKHSVNFDSKRVEKNEQNIRVEKLFIYDKATITL